MSPRTGRPKMKNPKNIDIKVRIDEFTNQKLLSYASMHGLTRAEVIRKAIDFLFRSE